VVTRGRPVSPVQVVLYGAVPFGMGYGGVIVAGFRVALITLPVPSGRLVENRGAGVARELPVGETPVERGPELVMVAPLVGKTCESVLLGAIVAVAFAPVNEGTEDEFVVGYGTFLVDNDDVPVKMETGLEDPSVGNGRILELDIG